MVIEHPPVYVARVVEVEGALVVDGVLKDVLVSTS